MGHQSWSSSGTSTELEKYLQVGYLEYKDREQAYFQLQFVEVNMGSSEKVDI